VYYPLESVVGFILDGRGQSKQHATMKCTREVLLYQASKTEAAEAGWLVGVLLGMVCGTLWESIWRSQGSATLLRFSGRQWLCDTYDAVHSSARSPDEHSCRSDGVLWLRPGTRVGSA